jgi:hydrogenase maturation protease
MLSENFMTQESPDTELKKNSPPRVVVIGVGNLLLKDEGIGIHAIKALQEINLPQGVKIIDGGTAPDLIAHNEAEDKLIIIDAAKAGGEPGTIYRLQPRDLSEEGGEVISVHELGVAHNLRLMSLMGKEPGEIVIIGVEPKEIDWGTELSPDLQTKVPEIVRAILKEIDKTGQ